MKVLHIDIICVNTKYKSLINYISQTYKSIINTNPCVHSNVASFIVVLCICIYRVLITATDIEDFPSKLVFFNNYEEDRDLGKGMSLCSMMCVLYYT